MTPPDAALHVESQWRGYNLDDLGVQAMTDPRYVNVMVVLTLIGFAVLAFTFLQHGSG